MKKVIVSAMLAMCLAGFVATITDSGLKLSWKVFPMMGIGMAWSLLGDLILKLGAGTKGLKRLILVELLWLNGAAFVAFLGSRWFAGLNHHPEQLFDWGFFRFMFTALGVASAIIALFTTHKRFPGE